MIKAETISVTRRPASAAYHPREGTVPAMVIKALRNAGGPMRTTELVKAIGRDVDTEKLGRAISAGLITCCVISVPGKKGTESEYRLGHGVAPASHGTLKPTPVIRRDPVQPEKRELIPIWQTPARASAVPDARPPRMPWPMGEHNAPPPAAAKETDELRIQLTEKGRLKIWRATDASCATYIDNATDLRSLAIMATAAADLAERMAP